MLKRFPERGIPLDEINSILDGYGKNDIKNSRGRLFTYFYDPGLKDLDDLSSILLKFYNRNGMDYHAFPSTLKIENDLISMMSDLMHGNDDTSGTFTTGGTESILLAMKAARDLFLEKKEYVPEIVAPVTAHPAFSKAAKYLGMKITRVPVNEDYIADDTINEYINDRTAAVIASAPSFPYGGIDNIKDISEIALDKNTWFHVDACVGGMILPFLKGLGLNIKDFDFKLPGVSSMSIDLHKYGFTPKGSSVVLYKNHDLRKRQIYVNADWPGYPMSNMGMQATKSAGPLAGSWATLNYLGLDGYKKLAEKTLKAYRMIRSGITDLGYKIIGRPDATIFAFTHNDKDIIDLGIKMIENGWYPQIQPGNVFIDMPDSVHLNISPVHLDVADEFLEFFNELDKNVKPRDKNSYNVNSVEKALEMIKMEKSMLFRIIRYSRPEVSEKIFLEMTDEDFTYS
ncbi:pyridoxal phosphate-dependent decarboxylase family protein [Picrophilus oshimae]|uniref:Glutamate decarboxylase n=1 Tax=Picrophilus torridus (strain ATCC 700027 / DSM 9790 / JCM 10055 / NBRC 100828 / KAW 2/3) TaxID=1122961 RepID=Q6L2R7_PICTO|nr:aspartate aminotransferase family protein [Picrophilus oshimae]AAT42735.1 glutamate decarboxylase [Picrophilus oshimae DSM 9789]